MRPVGCVCLPPTAWPVGQAVSAVSALAAVAALAAVVAAVAVANPVVTVVVEPEASRAVVLEAAVVVVVEAAVVVVTVVVAAVGAVVVVPGRAAEGEVAKEAAAVAGPVAASTPHRMHGPCRHHLSTPSPPRVATEAAP